MWLCEPVERQPAPDTQEKLQEWGDWIHRGGSDRLGYSQGHEEQGPSQPYLIPLVKVLEKGALNGKP